MRTLMRITSIAMMGTGIFCIANGSAAFITVAFLIGSVFLLMGICEIIVGIKADFDITGRGFGILSDGIIAGVIGIVILTGQIVSDTTAQSIFAMWLLIEGVLSIRTNSLDVYHNTLEENTSLLLNILMILLAVYTFFNVSTFNFKAMILIGIAIILTGFRRFRTSFEIEYIRPRFLTGNQDRLDEALAEEKRALAKAKEGIREQKNAQRRIQKIKENMAEEREVLREASIRRMRIEKIKEKNK
ncbi:MAG TPA: hypothetical protein GX736_00010 [Mogibacterium sp.]|nr:hypothetical protein [Mogibacterium sp.]